MTAPIDYGAMVLAPVAVALQQQYPELHVELLAADRVMDLVADHIDVAIRIGRLADSGHRATRIGSFVDQLVASPGLLRERPAPKSPAELDSWPFIALTVLPHATTWTFSAKGQESEVRFRASMSTNSASALRSAALAGGGLAILPDFVVADDLAAGRLVHLLPDWRLPTGGIHAVFPAARHMPRKTRVLIDALKAQGVGS